MPKEVISTKAEREALFDAVCDAQAAFERCVRDLERSYGPDAEIDHSDFLEGTSFADLEEEMREDGYLPVTCHPNSGHGTEPHEENHNCIDAVPVDSIEFDFPS